MLNQYGFRQGGPIVIPGAVRRPRQGVLLLQLRRAAAAEQLHAHAQRAEPDGAGAASSATTPAGTASEQVDVLALAARNGHVDRARSDGATACSDDINAATADDRRLNQHDRSATRWTTSGRARAIRSRSSRSSGSTTTSPTRHRLERRLQLAGRRARSRSAERRRRPLPGRAQLQPVHLVPAAHVRRRCARRSSSNMVNELRGGIRWGPGVLRPRRRATARRRSRTRTATRSTSSPATTRRLNLTNWHQQNGRRGGARGAGTSTTR